MCFPLFVNLRRTDRPLGYYRAHQSKGHEPLLLVKSSWMLRLDLFCFAFTNSHCSDFFSQNPIFLKAISTAMTIGSKGCSDHYGWTIPTPPQTIHRHHWPPLTFPDLRTAPKGSRKPTTQTAAPPPPPKLVQSHSGSWNQLISHDRLANIFCKGKPQLVNSRLKNWSSQNLMISGCTFLGICRSQRQKERSLGHRLSQFLNFKSDRLELSGKFHRPWNVWKAVYRIMTHPTMPIRSAKSVAFTQWTTPDLEGVDSGTWVNEQEGLKDFGKVLLSFILW